MKQPLSDIRETLPAVITPTPLVRPRVGPFVLPPRPPLFYRVMGATYLIGSGALVGAGLAIGTLGTGLFWGFAIGMLGASLLRGARSAPENSRLLEKRTEVQMERAAQIQQLLRVLEFPPTIEEIARRLRWKDPAVIDGLTALMESQQIVEDIHFETGEWTYALPGTAAARIQSAGSIDALSLDIEYAYQESLTRTDASTVSTSSAAAETASTSAATAPAESGVEVGVDVVEEASVPARR